jgi:Mg2+/citrate symporter
MSFPDPMRKYGKAAAKMGVVRIVLSLYGLLELTTFCINCMSLTSNTFLCSVNWNGSIGRATRYGLDSPEFVAQ